MTVVAYGFRFKTIEDLAVRVLKDTVLLKKGILIYLKHLAPYLSRIADTTPEQYEFLRGFLINDTAARVQDNIQKL